MLSKGSCDKQKQCMCVVNERANPTLIGLRGMLKSRRSQFAAKLITGHLSILLSAVTKNSLGDHGNVVKSEDPREKLFH